jgi:putative oxidoreductase
MSTRIAAVTTHDRITSTAAIRHTVVPRLLAGLPLFVIGVVHVIDDGSRMQPLVEAAGLPVAGILSPVAVAIEIIAGLSLLLGAWARVGALLAIPTMVIAVYAHLVIEVWPNGGDQEPPLALPLVVILCAAYVLWRGAGRWSVDRRLGTAA